MALIISNTYLSSSLRTAIFHNQCYNHTSCSHNNLHLCTGLFTCKALSSSNDSDHGGSEESRWRREEQRWLREEQRWLREESRWSAERNSLLLQIQRLQSELNRIRARNDSDKFDVDFVVGEDDSASKTLVKMAAILKGLVSNGNDGDSKRITDFSDKLTKSEVSVPVSPDPVAAPVSPLVKSEVEADVPVIPVNLSDRRPNDEDKKSTSSSSSSLSLSLRMGAEGDEVRILQEALMSLGFYSGEDDMEYSSFSDGTARAVKTWQASIGIREDGIMTAELLQRLYASQGVQSSELSLQADIQKIDVANGAVTEVREIQQTMMKNGPTDVDVNHHRVFLLGENRWEEPSRLNKTKANPQVSGPKCLACKGEGRLLCIECDGTGEPNVEEQFLDWVEEELKCPYCEGLGYTVCDICEGKPVI